MEPALEESAQREPREKSLERQVRAFHWVRLLAEIPGRLPGAPSEREAADRVESWMREVGLDEVAQQGVAAPPETGASLAACGAVAAVGVLLGGLPGLALVTLAAASFRRELARGGRGLASPLRPADSITVLGRAGATRPRRRVVLAAPLDAPRCGGWLPALLRQAASGEGRRGPLAWAEHLLAAALVVAGATALGADGALATLARGAVVAGLAAGAIGGVLWARAEASPGANRNGSGVAALLTCTEQLLSRLPPDVELWAAAVGGGTSGRAGLAALAEAHPDWPQERTWWLGFDGVGAGDLHWIEREGVLDTVVYPPMLPELARRVAESGAYADVTRHALRADTAAGALAERGLHALVVVSQTRGQWAREGEASDLPDALDMETVVRAADFGAAVVAAVLRGEAEPLAIV